MKRRENKTKALVLLSGGLDSILVVKILQEQDVEVTGIIFVSYFFSAELGKKSAEQLKIKYKIFDFSDEHLNIVKSPPRGYGKAMNPCIDCHLLMLKKAKIVMEEEKFDLVATGEVLGQRPMSQNRQALKLIEKESGLKGYLLRPLSANLLEPTIIEEKKKIDRSKLLNISGKNRKIQMALVKKYNIKEYSTPAGGCCLTDSQFTVRFNNMLENWSNCNGDDVALLKLGRHFWNKSNLIIVGRNKEENDKIDKLRKKKDKIIEPDGFPGPTILIRSKDKILKESLSQAEELMIKYSSKSKLI